MQTTEGLGSVNCGTVSTAVEATIIVKFAKGYLYVLFKAREVLISPVRMRLYRLTAYAAV